MFRNPDEKFIDEDLRHNPGLMNTAAEYAKNYSGNFQFMREARRRANREGVLPLQMARAVLNCMLAAGEQIEFEEGEEMEARPHLHIVKPAPPLQPARRSSFYVNHDLKRTFMFSTHRQAFKVHIIRSSYMLYRTAQHSLSLTGLQSYCQSHLSEHLMGLSNTIPDGYSLCNGCVQAQEAQTGMPLKVTG